jgi:hypothetical protein
MGRRRKTVTNIDKEFTNPSPEQVVGNFEAFYDLDSDISTHKETIKAINLDLKGRIEECAREWGCEASELRQAYKYWKKRVIDGKEVQDNASALMAAVDVYVENNIQEKEE